MAQGHELRGGAARLRAALTPHPHRGDLIAAGAGALTIGVLLVNVRLAGTWANGPLLLVTALTGALVLGMGVLAPLEGERPRAYQQVLQLAGLALLLVVLTRLARLLGAHAPLGLGHGSAGSRTWIFAALGGTALWLAVRLRSAICALVAAIVAILTALSLVSWIFDPSGVTTFRWLLLALAVALVFEALALREHRRRESVYLLDAAGVAIVLLSLTWIGGLIGALAILGLPTTRPGAGWRLVLLAADLGLIAYGAVDRESGPAYAGLLGLALWIGLVGAAGPGGASVWFWPLALVLVGLAGVAAGLRPVRPLPPEPAARDGEPPDAPVPGPGIRSD